MFRLAALTGILVVGLALFAAQPAFGQGGAFGSLDKEKKAETPPKKATGAAGTFEGLVNSQPKSTEKKETTGTKSTFPQDLPPKSDPGEKKIADPAIKNASAPTASFALAGTWKMKTVQNGKPIEWTFAIDKDRKVTSTFDTGNGKPITLEGVCEIKNDRLVVVFSKDQSTYDLGQCQFRHANCFVVSNGSQQYIFHRVGGSEICPATFSR